jgi:hypothetical protein
VYACASSQFSLQTSLQVICHCTILLIIINYELGKSYEHYILEKMYQPIIQGYSPQKCSIMQHKIQFKIAPTFSFNSSLPIILDSDNKNERHDCILHSNDKKQTWFWSLVSAVKLLFKLHMFTYSQRDPNRPILKNFVLRWFLPIFLLITLHRDKMPFWLLNDSILIPYL